MIKLRIFKNTDAVHVSRLIRKTMMSTNNKDYPVSILKPLYDYFTPTKIKLLATERYCLVAEHDGKIVGTGAFEDDELMTIFIDPKYHGQGIGKKLVFQLETEAKRRGILVMNVPASLTGIQFYEKLGYKKVKKFMSEHAGPQVLMKKKL